jgi:hypothetical protein
VEGATLEMVEEACARAAFVLSGGHPNNGSVVKQGFWYDLKAEPEHGDNDGEGVGEFREMLEAQHRDEGVLSEKAPLEPSSLEPLPFTEEKVHALLDSNYEDANPVALSIL